MEGDVAGTGTLLEGFPGGSTGAAMTIEATPTAAAPQAVPEAVPQAIPETSPSSGQQAGNVPDYEALLKEQRAIQGGMQRTVDALKAQVAVEQQAKVGLQEQLTELQAKQTEAGSEEITLLRQKVENLETEKATWEATMQAKDKELERVVLIAKDYPALAGPLLEAKALPQAEDEAQFRAMMDRLVGTVTAQAEAVYQAQVAGARPPVAPQAEQLPDADTLHKQILQATKDGDKKELERLQGLWYTLVGTSSPKP